jgi:transposase-like protein
MGKRSQAREKHWREVIQEYEGSGMTVREFCAKRQMNESQLYFWKRELQRRDEAKRTARPAKREAMLPVEVVVDASKPMPRIEILVDDSFRVAVEPGFDPHTLGEVLQVLEQRRC